MSMGKVAIYLIPPKAAFPPLCRPPHFMVKYSLYMAGNKRFFGKIGSEHDKR